MTLGKKLLLKLELAIIIDAGEQFVKSTYSLEEMDHLFFAYEEISKVSVSISTAHY